MTSAEDYIIKFIGKDSVTNVQKRIKKGDQDIKKSGQEAEKQMKKTEAQAKKTQTRMNAFKVGVGTALSSIGAGLTMFTQQAVTRAIESERSWIRVYGLMKLQTKEWDTQGKKVKEWASNFAGSYGLASGEIRETIEQSLAFGNSWEETQKQVEIASMVSTATGKTVAESQKMLQNAYMNKGRAFERITGIMLEGAKREDGTIDKQKLNAKVIEKYSQTLQDYRNTEYSQMVRAENEWNKIYVVIGSQIVPALTPFVDVLREILKYLNNLPQAGKQLLAYGTIGTIAFSSVTGPLTLFSGLLGMSNINLGNFTKGLKGAKIGTMSLTSVLGPLLVVVLAIASAYAIFNYLEGEHQKRLASYRKEVTDTIPKLREIRKELEKINDELERDPKNPKLQTKKEDLEKQQQEQWNKIGEGWRKTDDWCCITKEDLWWSNG
jgi:hypothetical protein